MNRKSKVHVVPHSHWDREWYFTIEDSNVILVENLDRLIDVMERDSAYTSYVFDAQVSVVQDYLAIRPENQDRLQALIDARRIMIGPWYTQTDTLLVNTESVIRNLLYGTRMAKELGHSMQVGYLPDIFGQNAYLPSIFQQFGMQHSVLQRGVYTEQVENDLNFWWTSPDGSSVKTNYMYFGYGPGKFLEPSASYFEQRLNPILETLEGMNESTDQLLLPAGGDQVLVREHFPATVEWLNKHDDNREYVLSNYEKFMREAWESAAFKNTIHGELIAGQKSRIHSTIRSHRIDLKQHNYRVENKMLHRLEPLASIAASLGIKYPRKWMDNVWKQLFDVHAHDSIGGCNSDDTNRNIEMRLTRAERIIDGLMNILKKQLARAVSAQTGCREIALAFNYLPRRQKSLMPFVVFTKSEQVALTDRAGNGLAATITKQDYISGGKQIVVTAEGERQVEVPGYYRTELLAEVDTPPLGYTTVKVVEGKQTDVRESVKAASIQNQRYTVKWIEGQLVVADHVTGQTIHSLMRFEDAGDHGDSYDYSPLEGDTPTYSAECELVEVTRGEVSETLRVRHRLNLPADLEERTLHRASRELIIHTEFELRSGEEFIRIEHSLHNNAYDHRLRVLFRQKADHTWADQGYTALRREKVNPHMQNWKENGFAEAPVSIYPLENYVVAEGDDSQLGLITEGIKEYELLEEELALTLFRSVGLLGRDDLAWRPGRASGINNKAVATPDAQLQKQLTFRYAVHTSNEKFQPGQWSALTERYIAHTAAYHLQELNTFEERLERFDLPQPIQTAPSQFSVLEVTGLAFVSCTKLTEDGEGLIIRLFNPSAKEVAVTVDSTLYQHVKPVSLAEEPVEGGGNTIEAKAYKTLKLLCAKE
ncbi:glycoside hydrolase family 38 C-terminal domain-containing protein [Paenibacillus xerothermodurans]|uniref:Alpha-mannosidase n=1 Tax=Paenibacillus xerothermodurans TaxID=1977292 RepID=A0A2W1NDH2_PAEXE|nr:glycoside hydrolase family 38 C-terminal domain-containing protein [Paenibacillus xerothermodurans]PZE21151.1 alpha-mannosidase [Paenibacillus xerothermodurans]